MCGKLKVFVLISILQNFHGISAKPFLSDTPRQLANFFTSASASAVSSASSASSPLQQSNISDLRKSQLVDISDDDDFFKEADAPADGDNNNFNQKPATTETSPVLPNFFSQKIQKIIQKFQFISSLANPTPSTSNTNDDDFQKEIDDFDKEYEEDVKNLTKSSLGNVKNGEIQLNKLRVDPSGIGVYFMELVGTFVGLIYGALTQGTYSENVTVNTV